MSTELILWGRRPEGDWMPIVKGSAAECRRERAARTPSTYWQDLSVLPVGTPVPEQWKTPTTPHHEPAFLGGK